jgi:hypothetical protein
MAIYPQPIPQGAIDLTPARPEFQQSFADTMGNAGDDSDGFDSIIAPIFQHIADGLGFLAALDSGLLDIGVSTNDLGTPFHADAEASLVSALQGGQGAFDSFNGDLNGQPTPAPTPTPPPTPAPTPGGTPTPVDLTVVLNSRPPIPDPKVLIRARLIE